MSLRLNREDCKRTKHDSVFSPWKILIGPLDWENYSVGKDGVERYRIYNLPSRSCPGLYELGIAASHTDLGRNVNKLDQDRIIVVYLGQAENVRTRLQHYGRAGSHLEQGKSRGFAHDNRSSSHSKGPGLFREIFSRGFPILFRWAPMQNKKEAEWTESQLLGIFDYAWNKGGNGVRRPNDIHLKLDRITSRSSSFISIGRKLKRMIWHHSLGQKREGITIKATIPPPEDNTPSTCYDRETLNHHSLILKFEKWKPRLLADEHGINEDISERKPLSCELPLEDVSTCNQVMSRGRQIFEMHKEKNAGNLSTIFSGPSLILKFERWKPRLVAEKFDTNEDIPERKSHSCELQLEDESTYDQVPFSERKSFEMHKEASVGNLSTIFGSKLPDEEFIVICGIALSDGSVCKNSPVEGRKRCMEHKGRRLVGR